MATVTGMTANRMLEIEAGSVVNAHIDGSSHLIFTKHDGTTIDAGPILTAFPIASDILQGIVELATDVETVEGTDGERAVTPLGLASLTANDTRKGLVELATNEETTTGTDDVRAVTPAGLAAVIAVVNSALAGKQALDSDLTSIAGLSPANDDVVQRKGGVWSNRTMAQLSTALMATGEFPDVRLYNGSAYADADGAHIYVGNVDPGSVPNGSVWFDTTV
jgi:hypothetical protein